MTKRNWVKVGVARNKETKRWHIIAVAEKGGEAKTSDDLTFATKAEAMEELERQIKTIGYPYEFIQ